MPWYTCWADWRHQDGVYSSIKWTWRSENYSGLAFRSLNDTLCKASMDQKSQMFLPTPTNNLQLRTFAPLSQWNVIQKVWLWILMYWVRIYKEWRIFDWHCRLHNFWQTCICIEASRTRHSKCIKLWLCEAFFKLALLLLLCAFNSPCAAHNNSHNGMLWTIFDLGALVMRMWVQIFVMIKRKKMVFWDTDQIQVKTRPDKNAALLTFYLSGCQGGPTCWSPSPSSHEAPGTKSFFPWIKIHLRSDLIKHQGDVDLSHTSLISGPSLIRISP